MTRRNGRDRPAPIPQGGMRLVKDEDLQGLKSHLETVEAMGMRWQGIACVLAARLGGDVKVTAGDMDDALQESSKVRLSFEAGRLDPRLGEWTLQVGVEEDDASEPSPS